MKKSSDKGRIALRMKVDDCSSRRGYVKDIEAEYAHRELDYHNDLGVPANIPLGNMSFCMVGDHRLVALRQFNYVLSPGNAVCNFFSDFMHDRAYHFFLADKDFKFVKKVECDYDSLHIMEDIRLMACGDTIQASGTDVSLGSGKHRMACLEFRFDGDRLSLVNKTIFPEMREKNYIPVEGGQGVFISDILNGKMKILTSGKPSYKQELRCRGIIGYRGSSQLLRYGIGYAAMVHRRERHNFYNAFAFFDKALLQCRISSEFTVMKSESPVSFCCGMSIEDGMAVLPFCIHDKTTYLFKLPLQDFLNTAKWR